MLFRSTPLTAGEDYTVDADGSITVTLPGGLSSGLFSVTTSVDTAYAPLVFTVDAPAPTISGVTATVDAGSDITITGANLSTTSSVVWNGYSLTFTAGSTSITATIPAGATGADQVTVTTAGGVVTSSGTVTVNTYGPVISSLSPTAANGAGVGETVTITGSHFVNVTGVTFAGIPAAYTVASPTSLLVTVPVGAVDGVITVTTAVSSATSASYIVTDPVVTGLTPTSGAAGTQVTITGTNLTDVRSVSFDGTEAGFVVSSPTTISATVPAGATDGVITLTAPSGSDTTSS